MYKSPIEVYCNEVYQKFNENFDNACVNAVIQAGFHVDKEELARALAYDRGAYEVGYADGLADGRKEREMPRPMVSAKEMKNDQYLTSAVDRAAGRKHWHDGDGPVRGRQQG